MVTFVVLLCALIKRRNCSVKTAQIEPVSVSRQSRAGRNIFSSGRPVADRHRCCPESCRVTAGLGQQRSSANFPSSEKISLWFLSCAAVLSVVRTTAVSTWCSTCFFFFLSCLCAARRVCAAFIHPSFLLPFLVEKWTLCWTCFYVFHCCCGWMLFFFLFVRLFVCLFVWFSPLVFAAVRRLLVFILFGLCLLILLVLLLLFRLENLKTTLRRQFVFISLTLPQID